MLKLLRAFPEFFLPIFTHTGNVAAVDVIEAFFVHEDTKVFRSDKITLAFLNRFIEGCLKEGMDF